MRHICFFPLILSLLAGNNAFAKAKPRDWLRACWHRQAQPLQAGGYLALAYRESVHELEHSAQPWQTTDYAGRGMVWAGATDFLKQDTLTNVARQRTYFSSTQRSATSLLFRDYGDKDLAPATPAMQQDYVFRAARYAPVALLSYCGQQPLLPDEASTPELAHYHLTINQTVVGLAVRKQDALLAEVTLLSHDDLLGDVVTTFRYAGYATLGRLAYPTIIQVAKANGKVQDEVRIGAASVRPAAPTLLTAPSGYHLAPKAEPVPTVQATQYRPGIYFLELKHTDDRVLVVEFPHFLLVAEAPLNSQNGELIIREAQKIAPGKPVRYFVAGHYHPHYLGGLRPFVRRGATVLCGAGTADYARYLAAAPHTLRPDSLQRHPTAAQVEEVTTQKTIADGPMELQIFCIGKQSEHTNDYLIYYFPKEKLLFEDDLVWLRKQGAAGPPSARQAGLYRAVQALGLAVETVAQSWPVADYGVKTIIPFTELTQAMQPAKP